MKILEPFNFFDGAKTRAQPGQARGEEAKNQQDKMILSGSDSTRPPPLIHHKGHTHDAGACIIFGGWLKLSAD
jgi:hypothetical protein